MSETASGDFTVDRRSCPRGSRDLTVDRSCLRQLVETSRWTEGMSETVSRDFTVDRRSCLRQLVETSRWTKCHV